MSAPIDDGGPAYPFGDYTNGGEAGMTLRDYFAGQALVQYAIEYQERMSAPDIAIQCYSIADAMIAARKGGPQS